MSNINDANGFEKIKNLIKDKDVISGPHDFCHHNSSLLEHDFSEKYPCIWDERILFGKKGKPRDGCYHKCFLRHVGSVDIIKQDKDVFIRSLDKYINFLTKNPNWNPQRESMFAGKQDKYQIKWRPIKNKAKKKLNEEIREARKQENERRFAHIKPEEWADIHILNSKCKPEKEITLYVRGSANYNTYPRTSTYYLTMDYKGHRKDLYATDTGEKVSVNKSIINGIADAVRSLKEPCSISVKTHTETSISRYNIENSRFSHTKNFLLIKELNKAVVAGRHRLSIEISDDMQDILAKKIKRL